MLIKICVLSCLDKRFTTCITASVFFGDESCLCYLSPVFSVMNAVSYCVDFKKNTTRSVLIRGHRLEKDSVDAVA